ncbi:glycine receptor subunit alpha-2 [Caerostris extrusa]|uniref:Glycine receptor subunit alpha-2 n=1 Tax=Caerostris extrusa TaxID=172846 RepID=A0AAV4XGE8_CAEEX|nr:glycine receptor subunit alpha-2 [Caerostris extrusa]
MNYFQDFRIHGYVYSTWVDNRLLISDTEIINFKCSRYLWVPDMVFETAKSTKQFGNKFFYIDKDKSIIASERYAFKTGCLMHFENYPFDTQLCMFSIALSSDWNFNVSFILFIVSSNDNEVHPQWDKENANEPISFSKKIEPLQFHLGKPRTYTTKVEYDGANFTYLYMSMSLKRRLTGSVVNIYAPSTLIVAVSWVTFWIRAEAAPARVALIVTSLLTLCTQKKNTSNISKISAADQQVEVQALGAIATLLLIRNREIQCSIH